MKEQRFRRLAGAAAARPVLTIAVVVTLALAGGLLALGLRPSADMSTFVSASSPSYRATTDDERHFGDQAVVILIHERLTDLVQTRDLATLTEMEACLGGQTVQANAKLRAFVAAPAGTQPPYGGWNSPCGHLMRSRATQVVYGPGTFLNRAVAAVNTQIDGMLAGVTRATKTAEAQAFTLARGKGLSAKQALADATAAGRLEYQQQLSTLETMAVSSGINGIPSIDDPTFIPAVVFDPTRGVNQPKARFAYLFPTADTALIQVRLRSSLSDAQQAQAIGWIRQAIAMPMFRSAYGGTDTVTGVPVVINDLSRQITSSITTLLIAVLLVMAAALLVVFRARWRLLPLALALAAAGITFGLLSIAGATLTLASIAVLPILVGLAVDYGIQFQARAEEVRDGAGDGEGDGDGAGDGDGDGPGPGAISVPVAIGRAAPSIATAALATGTGFLALLLSPVPMVQGFGLLLVVGIAVAFLCALTAGSAALVLAARRPAPALRDRELGVVGASVRGAGELLESGRRAISRGLRGAVRGAGEQLAPAVRGAQDILGLSRRGAPWRGASWRGRPPQPATGASPWLTRRLAGAVRRPGVLLAIGAVLALGGWVADAHTPVQSDVTKLVPGSMPALRNLHALEKVTGVSGEIDVTVHAHDVATPTVVGWMVRYENELLTHFGYLETRGCAAATLCPALSLPDLFSTSSQSTGSAAGLTQAQITTLLSAVPAYFKQAVITSDNREATLAFGIRLMPLSRQEQVIAYMRAHLHPPAGVSAALAGLPVLAADANAALASTSRRFLTLIVGLLAVGLVLLAVLRRVQRAIVPLVPIVLATGWSALVLWAIGIPLNPMSATLGTLVIAISTEFSVLLSERYRAERAAGHEQTTALIRTYRSTGRAVIASGVTAIVGFGVLIFSNITMLRDFGFVTLIDLTVSLAGVLLMLPAVLALAERDDLRAGWRAGAGELPRLRGGLRRRTRVAA